MHLRKTQAVALAVAGLMLVAGFASVLLGGQSATGVRAQNGRTHTIDILASGFNPQTCTVNRNDSTVYFENKDTKVRRVIQPAFTADPEAPPEWDSGPIQPGQRVIAFSITSQVRIEYEDFDNPAQGGVIIAPMDNGAQANCSPLPPTPTPTNTPTVTPTPTATPPAPPRPPACTRFLANPVGCLIAIWVSSDGPLQ